MDEESRKDAKAKIAAARVVSFDLFDTLLERSVGRPRDVFELVALEASDVLGSRAAAFAATRVSAEQAAREVANARGEDDVDLAAIYDEVARRLGLAPDACDRVCAIELEVERTLLSARPEGRALYEHAHALGKTVVLTSDMYLPSEFLREVLAANGYDRGDRLFVSSETKKTKATGRMYDLLVDALEARPSEILHVGDNLRADVVAATERGLVAHHLERVEARALGLDAFEALVSRSPLESSVAARAALTLGIRAFARSDAGLVHDGSLFQGSAHRLGYLGFGPLLLGFVQWLLRSSIDAGHTKLFFLARDGRVMLDAYERIAPYYPGAPAAAYLLSSRRAALVASIETKEDLVARMQHGFSTASLREILFGRYGVDPSDLDPGLLARHGLSPDALVTPAHRPALAALLDDISERIFTLAREEREAYVAYLDSLGFGDDAPSAVVDIGYNGSLQIGLDRLYRKRHRTAGYYLLTRDDARPKLESLGLSARAYLGDFVDREQSPFFTHIALYETIFSSHETSFVRMERAADGGLTPRFVDPAPDEAARVALVRAIHGGALQFIEDFARGLSHALRSAAIPPDAALHTLSHAFHAPSPIDAKIFLGVPFENTFGSGRTRMILPPEERLHLDSGLWEDGRHVILEGNGAARTRSRSSAWLDRIVVRVVDLVAARVLPRKKRLKLSYSPAEFFGDSRHEWVRPLGRIYVRSRRADAARRSPKH